MIANLCYAGVKQLKHVGKKKKSDLHFSYSYGSSAVFCFITFAFFVVSMKTFGSMELSHEFTDSVKKWAHFVRILTERFESVSDKYPCICFECLSPVNPSK